ncbi:DUF11 domain-containing protein [Fibrella sp. WM1]|uniref:DUF11 domain-containing protein n=1 Tax=Fibrella musci TaxID=3242485 RepID=UPI0035221B9C
MVVQRSNDNTASVQIAGSYSVQLDQVEGRFVSLQGGQTTAWATLQMNPVNGQFNGTLTAQGGWYRIEIRGKRNGQIVGTSSLAHFGIGEVFAIYGHSNAQGSTCNGTNECDSPGGATDERVVKVRLDINQRFHTYEQTGDPQYLPDPVFEQWVTGQGAAPFHGEPWLWARMGDFLVQKLGVPVLLYGAGFGGTSIHMTYLSMNNQYFEHGFCRWDLQMPYANLRNLMNLYVPSTGIRGILVIHGENDRDKSQEDIRMYFRESMKQIRQKLNKNQLAWVIAVSSYVSMRHDHVRNAQLLSVADINNDPAQAKVYLGPDLDPPVGTTGPTPYRPDGAHYSTSGQLYYAQLWADNLTANNNAFFTTSTPYLAEPQPLASITCANAQQLKLRLPDNFTTYRWDENTPGQERLVDQGSYASRVQSGTMATPTSRDQMRIYFPPAVSVAAGQKIPDVPSITASGLVLCSPSVTLQSSAAGRAIWNTGATTAGITVTTPGQYSVQDRHPAYDCVSGSRSVTVTPAAADLSIQVAGSSRAVATNETLTLTVTIRNEGPCGASGIQFDNQLPSNLLVTAADAGLTYTASKLTGTMPALAPGDYVSKTFTVKPTVSGYYTNAFQITAASLPDPDSQVGSGTGDGQDDCALVDIRTQEAGAIYVSPNPNQVPLPSVLPNQPPPDANKADLSLALASNLLIGEPGQVVSFSLLVHNEGGLDATNVQVQTDPLPTGLTFLSSPSGLTTTANRVGGTISLLRAGESATLVFTATLGSGTSGMGLPLKAEIKAVNQPDPDSQPGNLSAARGEDDEAQLLLRFR